MEDLSTENISHYDRLIENFFRNNKEYGDNYPIILYEPAILCEENEVLKFLIEQNNSIHLFTKFQEAFRFAQSLGIGFLFIASKDFDERVVIKNFQRLRNTFGRGTFDFEEEALLQSIFEDIPDDLIRSLELKVYVFWTSLEFNLEICPKKDEEEVMIMCDLKDMAKEFRQESVILWYDPQIQSEVKESLKKEFEIQEENIYSDFQELHQKIQAGESLTFHLILTGKSEANTIIDEMQNRRDMLLGLYVYCDDPETLKRKKRNIFIEETLEKLVPKITEGIRSNSKLINSFPVFATDFDGLDKSHIYNIHYYLKGLINFKNREQAKNDFIKLAKAIYQSRRIFEFEQEYQIYNKNKILEWYTKESPVYKLANNCLRIATSDSILYCRYILKDLEEAIKEGYSKEGHKYNGLVYRGAYLSQDEWKKLQENVGKEIEMYGFLSTSQNIESAKQFLYSDLKNKVLIMILIPSLPIPELNEQGFTDISQNSNFQEAEILFNVRSKFRILEAGNIKINDNGQECRHLVLLYGAELLRKFMTKYQPVIHFELDLPAKVKCCPCGSDFKLFGFRQGMITRVQCLDCLRKSSLPENTPIFSLNSEKNFGENGEIAQSFTGKILTYNQILDLPFYGYKCYNCQESGKEKYYKWLALNEQKSYEQCSECFLKGKEIKAQLLFSESHPYRIWQENETMLEVIDSDYQVELSRELRSKCQGDVFFEVQNFNSSIQYGKQVIRMLGLKRGREFQKVGNFDLIGMGEEYSGNLKKALEYYQRALSGVISVFGENDALCISLYTNIGSVSLKSVEYQKALEYYQKALDITKDLFGEKHSLTARLYHNLASGYQSLGKYQQALEENQKALDIRKKLSGENHPDIADSYSSIGSIYQDLGVYQQAISSHQNALNINLAIYGEKNSRTAASYNNIALGYQNLGKYQQALECYQRALATIKDIFGEIHCNTADSYNNIATFYSEFGEYQQALSFHQRALDIRKDVFGEGHSATAGSLSNIASVYNNLANPQKALEYYQKALDCRKEVSGENHPDIALFYNGKASVYRNLSEHQQALELHQKALEIQKSFFGEKHSEIADSYDNMGIVYVELAKYLKALEYQQKALDIRKEIYGEKHPKIAASYHSIGVSHQKLGKHQHALKYHQKVLEIRKEFYGERHIEIGTCYYWIASVYQSLGKAQQAIEYFKKALMMLKEFYPDERHQYIAKSYGGLAVVSLDLGENFKTLEYYQKALNIQKDIFGEKHGETASSYINVGVAHFYLHDYKQALKYYEKALNLQKILRKEIHPDIAACYSNIALVYLVQIPREPRDLKKAVEYLQKALSMQKMIFGEKHSLVADLYRNFAAAYFELREYGLAFAYCKNALEIYKTVYGPIHPKTLRCILIYNYFAEFQWK